MIELKIEPQEKCEIDKMLQKEIKLKHQHNNIKYEISINNKQITIYNTITIPAQEVEKEKLASVTLNNSNSIIKFYMGMEYGKVGHLSIDMLNIGCKSINEMNLPEMHNLYSLEVQAQIAGYQETQFDISGLSKFATLESVKIDGANITSCLELQVLKNLVTIKLCNCQYLQSIDELRELKLQDLEIQQCRMLNEINLQKGDQLQSSLRNILIHLAGVKKINGLESTHLESLYISDCPLEILDFGTQFDIISKTLIRLEISSIISSIIQQNMFENPVILLGFGVQQAVEQQKKEKILKISGLQNLSLQKLKISNCCCVEQLNFGDIQQQSMIGKSLTEIDISNNGIYEIVGLSNLQIPKIEFSNMSRLKNLDFGNTQRLIIDNLKHVVINSTTIEKITNLCYTRIQIIDILQNQQLLEIDFGLNNNQLKENLHEVTISSCSNLKNIKGLSGMKASIHIVNCPALKDIEFQQCDNTNIIEKFQVEDCLENILNLDTAKIKQLILKQTYVKLFNFGRNDKDEIHKSLKDLQITSTQTNNVITNFSFGLQKSFISPSNNKEISIIGLETLSLQNLSLIGCNIQCIVLGSTNLKSKLQESLEQLVISNCSCSKIEGIENLEASITLEGLEKFKEFSLNSSENENVIDVIIHKCAIKTINSLGNRLIDNFSLSQCSQLKNFSSILDSSRVQQLHINQDEQVPDLMFLKDMNNLLLLELQNVNIKTISELKIPIVDSLQTLILKDTGIESVRGCEKFRNLKHLTLLIKENAIANQGFNFGFGGFGANLFVQFGDQPIQVVQQQPVAQQIQKKIESPLEGLSMLIQSLTLKAFQPISMKLLKQQNLLTHLNLLSTQIKQPIFLNYLKKLETLIVSVQIITLPNLKQFTHLKNLYTSDFIDQQPFTFNFGEYLGGQQITNATFEYVPDDVQIVQCSEKIVINEEKMRKLKESREYYQINPLESVFSDYKKIIQKREEVINERKETQKKIQQLRQINVDKKLMLKQWLEKLTTVIRQVEAHVK